MRLRVHLWKPTSPIRLLLACGALFLLASIPAQPAAAQGPCDPNPCQNGGQCQDDGTNFRGCRCPAGFEGQFCETPISSVCSPNPCLNGGSCQDVGDGTFSCDCLPGYSGTTCDVVANPCDPNPCQNGGSCESTTPTTFSCRCPTDFTGDLCEISNPCDPNPCQNGGACIPDGEGGFACDCLDGTSGELCGTIDQSCDPNPCLNGGSCEEIGGVFQGCRCLFGFEGEFCETAFDICDPNPCQNGGTCINNGNGTTSCECPDGFTGELCEEETGPCDPNPCQNGGTCFTDGVTFFGCGCVPPWSGEFCDVSTDPCTPDPCLNGGLCEDDGTSFLGCTCPPGYDGTLCENDLGFFQVGTLFDEGEGVLTDFGAGLSGVLEGGAGFTDGQQESAGSFDGTGYVVVDDPGSGSVLDFTSALTVTLWARPDELGGTQMLVSKDDAYELEIGKLVDDEWGLRLNNVVVGLSSEPVVEDLWQHLAFTWDGSTVRFYRNGEPAGAAPWSTPILTNDNALGVGGRPSPLTSGGPVFLFTGAIDDVRLYDVALSEPEIVTLVASTVSDAAAPFRSDPVPVSPLPAGTTSATLGLTTDELAFCRLSLAPGDGYDDMVVPFTTTGSTTHTFPLTGLTDGSINRYYARCRDPLGNTNPDDLEIAFGVGDVDLVSDLVAFWPLDEGSGCDAFDATGMNDGVLGPDCLGSGDAPSWIGGINGSGLSFDGVDDEVLVASAPSLDTPGVVTVSAWIRHGTSYIFRPIVDRRDSAADGWDFYLTDQSRLFMRVDDGVLAGNAVVADGSWHHVAGVYDGNQIRLYVDGALDATATVGAKAIDVDADLLLGRHFAGTDYPYHGALDEVMIYHRALTDLEVFQVYLSTQP